jgi:hypothetical protein
VDVRARCRAGDGMTEGDERNSCVSKVSHYRLSFIAIRMNGHIHRVPVIESEMVVSGSLSVSTNRE